MSLSSTSESDLRPISQYKGGPEEGIGSYAATYETFVFQGKTSQDHDGTYLRECYDLRIQTFYVEQKFPIDKEFDDMEMDATHVLIQRKVDAQRMGYPSWACIPIGTIRGFEVHNAEYYKIGRLAVAKEFRGRGFARDLVNTIHEWIKKDVLSINPAAETVKVVLHSQIHAKGFYAKFGYVEEGDEFDEDGAPHQRMVTVLKLV